MPTPVVAKNRRVWELKKGAPLSVRSSRQYAQLFKFHFEQQFFSLCACEADPSCSGVTLPTPLRTDVLVGTRRLGQGAAGSNCYFSTTPVPRSVSVGRILTYLFRVW